MIIYIPYRQCWARGPFICWALLGPLLCWVHSRGFICWVRSLVGPIDLLGPVGPRILMGPFIGWILLWPFIWCGLLGPGPVGPVGISIPTKICLSIHLLCTKCYFDQQQIVDCFRCQFLTNKTFPSAPVAHSCFDNYQCKHPTDCYTYS